MRNSIGRGNDGWRGTRTGSSNWTSGGPPNRSRMPASLRRGGRPHAPLNAAATINQLSTYLAEMAQKGTAMNKYGRLAQEHWRRHAPRRYEALENPSQYFEDLGVTAELQISDLIARLGSQSSNREFMDQVAHLRSTTKQAEEMVLADLVYSVTAETSTQAEELLELLALLPSLATVEDLLGRLAQEAEDEAEREGWSQPLLSDDQQAQQDRWTGLLTLLQGAQDPEAMSTAALKDLIASLRTYLPSTDEL